MTESKFKESNIEIPSGILHFISCASELHVLGLSFDEFAHVGLALLAPFRYVAIRVMVPPRRILARSILSAVVDGVSASDWKFYLLSAVITAGELKLTWWATVKVVESLMIDTQTEKPLFWNVVPSGLMATAVEVVFTLFLKPVYHVGLQIAFAGDWQGVGYYLQHQLPLWIRKYWLVYAVTVVACMAVPLLLNVEETLYKLIGAKYDEQDLHGDYEDEEEEDNCGRTRRLSVPSQVGISLLCSLMVESIWCPLDTALFNCTAQPEKYSGVLDCLRCLWKEGGLSALYVGLVPATLAFALSPYDLFRIVASRRILRELAL